MGTGYHGGFGNTNKAIKKASKKGELQKIRANYTREMFIKELEGVTEISTAVAIGLRNGDVHINVLGDKLFEEYLGVSEDTLGLQEGKYIYLRSSSASIISDLVHEGNHLLEYLAGVDPKEINTWPGEIRAYRAEREFQIKSGREVTFLNDNDLLVHVWSNYKRYEP